MLYFNLAFILLCFQPFWLYAAFKLGEGQKENVFLPKRQKKKRELSLKEQREIKEWENILNYDGTRESQEVI